MEHLTKKGVFFRCEFSRYGQEKFSGFSGLVGAKRSEIMQAVFGADTYDSGEIWLDGEQVRF
mgnify:CR=1 FL=1